MNRFISLALLGAAMFLATSCSKGPGGKSSGPYGDAMKAVGECRFNAADSILADLAKTDSTGFQTTYGQGVSYEHQLMFCDALGSYLLTVSRYPDSGVALAAMSRMFTVLDAPEEALESARRWSQTEKGNNEARFRLIRAQIDIGQYPNAESSLDEARKVGLDKGVGDLLQARLQVVSHLDDDAAKVAAQARSESSESPDYFLALADYFEERGDIDSSIWAGTKSYELSKEVYFGYINFKRSLRHQYFTAARSFITELAKNDKTRIPSTAALLEYKVVAFEKVLLSRVADQIERLRPNIYTPAFLAIAARECIGDYNMARQHAEAIEYLTNGPTVYPPFRAFVRWHIFNTDFNRWPYPPADVMGLLDSLKGWRETLPRYQAMASGALLRDSTLKRFTARTDSLMTANAGNLRWLTDFGRTYSEAGELGHQTGDKAFRLVLKHDPQAIIPRCGLVNNAIDEFRYDDALAIMAEDPTFIDRCPEYGLVKSLCEAMLGNTAEAVASYEKSYPRVKGEITRVEGIVLELVRLGKTAEVNKIMSECLASSGNDADACRLASDVQFALGNYQASLDQADKGLQLEPEHARLKSYKARAMYAVGQKDEAKKLFDEIFTKAPNDPDASLLYSRILADENLDPSRAQNLARQAQLFGNLAMRPTINQAYVYIKGQRYDFAFGAAQQATVIYPRDPEAYFYLGISLDLAKRPGAKENLQKAISLGLQGEQLQTARETLKKL